MDVALDVEPVAAGHAALRRDGTRVEVTVVVDVNVRAHLADDVRLFRVVLVLAVAAVEIEPAAHEMDRALTDHSVADVEDRVLRRHVDRESELVEVEVRQCIRPSEDAELVAGDGGIRIEVDLSNHGQVVRNCATRVVEPAAV